MPPLTIKDPEVAQKTLDAIYRERLRRSHAVNELQREQNRIKSAERYRRKITAYFQDEGPLRRELYPKHMKFFEAGAQYRERALVAGNRTGKTDAGGYELTMHLTGDYPAWWIGKRFERPIQAWAAGNTNTTVRDILQSKLLGRLTRAKGDDDLVTGLGTGMIPGANILSTRPRSGIPDAIEIVYVKHKSGGTSQLHLKSYEQGREAFEGTEKDVIWLDEECPEDIYTECLIRTMTTNGVVYLTFTPLYGLTQVVMKFLPSGKVPDKGYGSVDETHFVVTASWDEVPHLTEEAKKALWASIPPYQREARSKGTPQLGSGAIYPVPEADISVKPFKIPDTWRKCYGMDVGWNRTAVIWLAEDPVQKVWYAWSEHYIGRMEPALQAQAIRARGETIPGVIDPAARGRGQKDGSQLIQDYKDLGLLIEPAKNTVESGLYEVWQLFSSGMLKVFDNLQNTLEEYRVYRRDDKGHVVKEKDHLMDGLRYAICSGRDRAKATVVTPQPPTQWDINENHNQGWMS